VLGVADFGVQALIRPARLRLGPSRPRRLLSLRPLECAALSRRPIDTPRRPGGGVVALGLGLGHQRGPPLVVFAPQDRHPVRADLVSERGQLRPRGPLGVVPVRAGVVLGQQRGLGDAVGQLVPPPPLSIADRHPARRPHPGVCHVRRVCRLRRPGGGAIGDREGVEAVSGGGLG
jgi:hypothetical protein